jgi:hypothetical protein
MLKRIATQPILQLCVCMCALASAVLIVACAPRMHTFDADGSGTTTLLESANGFVQQASSLRPNGGGGGGALKEIDARARAAATEWFDRVCCETAAFSRSGALSFHARVCASAQGRCATMASGTASKWGRRSRSSARSATATATSPQLRMWDAFCGAALRYAIAPGNSSGDVDASPTCARASDRKEEASACVSGGRADVDASAGGAEFTARAAVTAPWTFAVAIVFNALFALHLLLHSSMRLPLAALVVFALISAHPSGDGESGALGAGSGAFAHMLEESFARLKFVAQPFLGGAASFTFAFFPALAVGARALFPSSTHSVVADLMQLHAAWGAQDAAKWGRRSGAGGRASDAVLADGDYRPFAWGALHGAVIGLVFALAVLASTPLETFRRARAAVVEKSAEATQRLARFCAWPALLFLGAVLMGSVSAGTRFMFELRLILTPIAPVLFGLSPIGRLRNTWLIGLTVYAWALGGAHVGMMLPLLLIVLTHHTTQMMLTLALLGCCVFFEVGSHIVILPLLQLCLVPVAVALVRYALRVRLADDLYAKIFFAGIHVALVVEAVCALGVAVYVLPSALTTTLFCNGAGATHGESRRYFGTFCNVIIVHALHTHASRLWRAAEQRDAIVPTFREAVRAWAGEPPLYLLWLAVGASQRWTADLELAIAIECFEVFLRCGALVLKHHPLTAALWHMVVTARHMGIADGKRCSCAHLAFSIPNIKAVVMLAQVLHSASPWGCLPPVLVVVLCVHAMVSAAAAAYSTHLRVGVFRQLGAADNGAKVQRSIDFWERSTLMRGLCVATLPSHAELEALQEEIRGIEALAGATSFSRSIAMSLVKKKKKKKKRAEKKVHAGDAQLSTPVDGDAALDRRVLEAEQALRSVLRDRGNVTETRLAQIAETAAAMGDEAIPYEMRIAALLYAHFAPAPGLLQFGDLFFAPSIRAYFDLEAVHAQALDDAVVSVLGGAPVGGREPSEHWPPSALAPHLSPIEKLVDGVLLSVLERDGVLGTPYREKVFRIANSAGYGGGTAAAAAAFSAEREPASGWLVDLVVWLRSSVAERALSDHLRVLVPSLFSTARSILLSDSSQRELMLRSWFETAHECEERARALATTAAATTAVTTAATAFPEFWSAAALQMYAPAEMGRALREWALCKVDLLHALERAQHFSAMDCERDAAPRVDVREAAAAGAPVPASGAFRVGLCGSIAVDGVRSHKVTLSNCAIFESTPTGASSGAYKISNPPSLLEWQDLIAMWREYDAAAAKAGGTPPLPSRRLYVRPEYLSQKDERVPTEDGLSALEARAWLSERWFPARAAAGRSIYHQDAFIRYDRSARGGANDVFVRYLNEVSPIIGSTDDRGGDAVSGSAARRSLKVKQNTETKILNQPVFIGEIKIVGLECDLEFASPDDVDIALSDASTEGSATLSVSGANAVSVGIDLRATFASVTLTADEDAVEICLFNAISWFGDLTNRFVNHMISVVPFPIILEGVAVHAKMRLGVVAPPGRDAADESKWAEEHGINLSVDSIVVMSSNAAEHDLTPENLDDWPQLHKYLFYAIKTFTKKTIYHAREDLGADRAVALRTGMAPTSERVVEDFCDSVKEVHQFATILDQICGSVTDLSCVTWLQLVQLRDSLRQTIEEKRLEAVRCNAAAVAAEEEEAARDAAALLEAEARRAAAAAADAAEAVGHHSVATAAFLMSPNSPRTAETYADIAFLSDLARRGVGAPEHAPEYSPLPQPPPPPPPPPPRKVGMLRVAKHAFNLSEWFKLSRARIDGAAVTPDNYADIVPRKYVVLEPRRSAAEPARLCIFRDDPAAAGDVLEEILQPLSLGPRPCASRDADCFDVEFRVTVAANTYSFYAESIEARLYWLDEINGVQGEACRTVAAAQAAGDGGGGGGAARLPPSSPWIRRRTTAN